MSKVDLEAEASDESPPDASAVGRNSAALRALFDRQVDNLVRKGYPEIAGVTTADFLERIEPLRDMVGQLVIPRGDSGDRIPFVIVIKSEHVAVDKAIAQVELKGRTGFTGMESEDIARFKPIDGLDIPGGMAYLIVDVDTGKETLNVTPDDAMGMIQAEGRSPLTLEEGLALVTHHPEVLTERNCFSMLGSRCGDRRVTALWVSKGRPRLGWCWARNPHTWLGSATCGRRDGR